MFDFKMMMELFARGMDDVGSIRNPISSIDYRKGTLHKANIRKIKKRQRRRAFYRALRS